MNVLITLRHWEICSPDISAAIEFCREKIVDMTVDEYEMWFTSTFPKILRPRTAPPANKGQEGEGYKAVEESKSKTGQQSSEITPSARRDGTRSSYGFRTGTTRVSANHRFVQSAVARKS